MRIRSAITKICLSLFGIFCFFCFICSGQAQFFGLVDQRAKSAPMSVAKTPESLVTYLTKDITDDAQKARVIAAWIAFQVQRNGYRRQQLTRYGFNNRLAPPPVPNDVFRTRIGTPQEFASLYQQLGGLAGLEIVIIPGFAGYNVPAFRYKEALYQAAEVFLDQYTKTASYGLQRYEASWNAVRINGEWRLVDTYWMIGGDKLFAATLVQSDRDMSAFLKRRETTPPARSTLVEGKHLDNDFFFAKPNVFAKTHFPLDSSWQLLPVPVTWATFTTN